MNNSEFNIEAMRIRKEYQITKLKREINTLTVNIQKEKAALKINDNPLIQSNLDYDSRRMQRLQQQLSQLKLDCIDMDADRMVILKTAKDLHPIANMLFKFGLIRKVN